MNVISLGDLYSIIGQLTVEKVALERERAKLQKEKADLEKELASRPPPKRSRKKDDGPAPPAGVGAADGT